MVIFCGLYAPGMIGGARQGLTAMLFQHVVMREKHGYAIVGLRETSSRSYKATSGGGMPRELCMGLH